MHLVQGDEVKVRQAIGYAVDVAAAIGPLAAVDVEGPDAEGSASSAELRETWPSIAFPSAGPVGCGREASQRRPANVSNRTGPKRTRRRIRLETNSMGRQDKTADQYSDAVTARSIIRSHASQTVGTSMASMYAEEACRRWRVVPSMQAFCRLMCCGP